uniref:Uncharacterized protein n=2 Tax=Picea TaxID=3328 RepID=A0A117NJ23_PICGL|nr:hypothetical protein ABT39_MTgene729 [Picea glauca]QHR90189.1 hypothetical protein Q903MT_gene4212 [Picea sitchensis]
MLSQEEGLGLELMSMMQDFRRFRKLDQEHLNLTLGSKKCSFGMLFKCSAT